ncbi:MAG: putative manganese-dependent inorganic diphosphatase, partial [Butyricicoccaceae bacterium]
ANPDVMEDYIQENDMIILGNRYESQLCSIERRAGCIIIGLDSKVSRTIQKLAREANCTIIATPLDTYTCAKLINQAVPVRHVMRTDGIISFRSEDPVAEVKAIVAKKRMRYFPILDESGLYIGMVSQRNLLDMERQPVILVDHNERDQAPADVRSAEILEIIDHHRIDSVETNSPIYFRNEPLGSTATIIALMYQENNIPIEPKIAGLLCSAILSDTLMFRSPTCTVIDKRIARQMAEIAGIDLHEHAVTMFNSGSRIMACSDDAIFHMDYKLYSAKGRKFAVSQISSVSQPELDDMKKRMIPYLKELLPVSGMDLLFLMLTNVIGESTELLFAGKMAEQVVRAAFDGDGQDNSIVLPGIVSRKEQMITKLIAAIDEVF